MARGIPSCGYRVRYGKKEYFNNSVEEKVGQEAVDAINFVMLESDEDIANRINERFEITETLVESAITGDARLIFLSGAPGIGKSYTVEKVLKNWDNEGTHYTFVKGFSRNTGLIKMLYAHRENNMVLVFDDSDNLLYDEVALNILKCVSDTSETRRVSWLSEGKLVSDDTGETIPKSFDFNGSIIFLSNIDLAAMVKSKHKLAPHFEALMSRGYYIDLSIKSPRDYLVRIKQVMSYGMLNDMTDSEKEEVMKYIEDKYNKLREISVRTLVKVGVIRKNNPSNWERICDLTLCKM